MATMAERGAELSEAMTAMPESFSARASRTMAGLSMEMAMEAIDCDFCRAFTTRRSMGTPFTGRAHLWLTP